MLEKVTLRYLNFCCDKHCDIHNTRNKLKIHPNKINITFMESEIFPYTEEKRAYVCYDHVSNMYYIYLHY